jgi:hypothetical protein
MRTDHNCLCIFVELRTFRSGSVHDHRNGHFNPLAAPVFRQSVCMGEFFVVHKTTLLHSGCWPNVLRIQPYSPRGKLKTGFRVCLRTGVTPCTANSVPRLGTPFTLPPSRQPSSLELNRISNVASVSRSDSARCPVAQPIRHLYAFPLGKDGATC